MVPSLLLLSCELSVSVKENPDRKKKQFKVSLKVTVEGSFSNDKNARHHTYKFTKKYLARQSNPIQETYLWIFAAKKASITHYFKSVKSCFTV